MANDAPTAMGSLHGATFFDSVWPSLDDFMANALPVVWNDELILFASV
jgi:hypothetical protein